MGSIRRSISGEMFWLYTAPRTGCRKGRTRLFSEVKSDRTRGNGHKLECASFQPGARERFFPIRMVKYQNRTQKCCGVTILEDIQNLRGQGSEQPDPAGHALRRGLAEGPYSSPRTSTTL